MERSIPTARQEELMSQKVIQHYLQSPQRYLPALAYEICIYLAECYACGNVRLLNSRISAIGRWHHDNGFPDPTVCPSVINLSRRIRTETSKNIRVKTQAPPTISDLKCITDVMKQNFEESTPARPTATRMQKVACRNRAIWLICFWFGLTTSEVCRLTTKDIHLDSNSLTIITTRTGVHEEKTKYSFRLTRLPKLCPITALEDWFACAEFPRHYLFPRLSRSSLPGHVGSRSVHCSVRQLMAKKTPNESACTRSQCYSLYFFLAANGWSRKLILRALPFYQACRLKNRIRGNKNFLTAENSPSWLSKADMFSINLSLKASQYRRLT